MVVPNKYLNTGLCRNCFHLLQMCNIVFSESSGLDPAVMMQRTHPLTSAMTTYFDVKNSLLLLASGGYFYGKKRNMNLVSS